MQLLKYFKSPNLLIHTNSLMSFWQIFLKSCLQASVYYTLVHIHVIQLNYFEFCGCITAEPGEKIAPPSLLEQAAKAAESVADELARAEGREIALYDDPAPPLQLLLPDDGFSCDVVQGVPPGLADFLHPLQASGLCRLAAQPTSSGHWTVYMNVARPSSTMSSSQLEVGNDLKFFTKGFLLNVNRTLCCITNVFLCLSVTPRDIKQLYLGLVFEKCLRSLW